MTEVSAQGQKSPGLSGLTTILIATAVAGVAAYVVTWLVPRSIGLADYAVFAVFWSSVYLVVGALNGIQQEVTRGTRRVDPAAPTGVSRARTFGVVAGAIVFLAVIGTAPLWVSAVFPETGWGLVWPLAIGAASFVMVAVLAGSFYGVSAWVPIALMITVDALLRLVAVAVVLSFTTDVVPLAWAVVLPFPVTITLLWPFVRQAIVGKSQLDVGYRTLTWNVSRTILAAAATGVMVSGFPLLLGLTSRSEPKGVVGLYILTITLTRAPLIVVAMSLQSYFLVIFRDHSTTFWRQFLRLQALVFSGGIVLAAGGWLLGPMVFRFLFPTALQPSGGFIAVLVASSALVGSLCVSAPAVLARSQHFVYVAGWVAGALVTIASLLLPIDFTSRTVVALICAPIAALLVHASYLLVSASRERRSAGLTSA